MQMLAGVVRGGQSGAGVGVPAREAVVQVVQVDGVGSAFQVAGCKPRQAQG